MKKLFVYGALLLAGLSACKTRGAVTLEEPPIITSATYQHTLYNGEPQPIEATAARPGPPPLIVTYFPGEEALLRDEGGVDEAPAEPGSYYVRIRRPGGNGFAAGRDITVEYTIQKAIVTIDAEERQQVPYNGSPQRPAASAPVALTLSYRTLSGVPPESPHAAPAGPGLYRVTLSFAGDRRYYGASREIDFAILAEQPPSPGKM